MPTALRLTLTTAAVVLVALPAAAPAQTPGAAVTVSPNTPKTGTRLAVDLDGAQLGDTGGRPPQSVRLLVQPGFAFDPAAVAGRCAAGAATCPADARIGSGTATIRYTLLGIPGSTVATLSAYVAAPRSGDLAGIVLRVAAPDLNRTFTAHGRALRAAAPDGLELRFEDLLGGRALPPGTQVSLARLQLTAGASRTVTTTKVRRRRVRVKVRRNGRARTVVRSKRVRVKVRTRHDLLRTPPSCPGAWTGRVLVTLADGAVRELPVSAPYAAQTR